MAKVSRWTTYEQRILNEHYSAGIDTLKSKLPERSEGAIRCKMSTMGLKLPTNYSNFKLERLFKVELDG